MRLWIDCEWNDYRGDLISMALVDEAGREWYESLGCDNPSPWVAEHVIPIIHRRRVHLNDLRGKLQQFLSAYDSVHIIADWPEDIARFCDVLITGPGTRLNTPPLAFSLIDMDGAVSAEPHNALADARGNREWCLSHA